MILPLLLLVVGCPKDIPRVVKSTVVVPTIEGTPPPPKSDPLPGWRCGWTNATAVNRRPEEVWGFTLGGPITAPIVVDGDQVYAVADDTIYAFSADGHRLWESKLPGVQGAALSGDAIVAGGTDGKLVFLNRTDGKPRSATERGGALVGSPVPIDGGWAWVTEEGIVATNAGWLQSFGQRPAGRPAADESTVYVTTVEGSLFAVSPKGVEWTVILPAAAIDGPALDEDNVYVSFAAKNGEPGGVVAYGRWGPMLAKERWRFHGEFQPLAAVGADIRQIYVPEKDGNVYALDPNTGEKQWNAEGYGEFSTQPLVALGSVYAGNSDGHLARIDPDDGGVVWQVDLGAAVSAEPALVGNRLVVGLANGRIVALQ